MTDKTSRIPKSLFPLNGVVDIHSEAASPEILSLAKEAGLRALVLKWPAGPDSALAARFIQQARPDLPSVFGGIVLDGAVGGINATAVAASLDAGAVFIWMPVKDSVHHREQNRLGASGIVPVCGMDGRPLPEVLEVLELISGTDAVLGTGHLGPADAEAIITAARKCGVKKIMLNHPLLLGFSLELLERLRGDDLYFEHCYVPDHPLYFDVNRIIEAIEALGIEQSLIGDFGRYGTEANIADALVHFGLDTQTVRYLSIEGPAKLIGLTTAEG